MRIIWGSGILPFGVQSSNEELNLIDTTVEDVESVSSIPSGEEIIHPDLLKRSNSSLGLGKKKGRVESVGKDMKKLLKMMKDEDSLKMPIFHL